MSDERILLQENAVSVAKRDHYDGYMPLFEPGVRAVLGQAADDSKTQQAPNQNGR